MGEPTSGMGGGSSVKTTLLLFECSRKDWVQRDIPSEVRIAHGYGCVALGKYICVIGGGKLGRRDLVSKCVWRHDVLVRAWKRLADMNIARHSFQVALVQGRVVAIGGVDGSDSSLNSYEIYDPDRNTWELVECPGLETMSSGKGSMAVGVGNCFYTCTIDRDVVGVRLGHGVMYILGPQSEPLIVGQPPVPPIDACAFALTELLLVEDKLREGETADTRETHYCIEACCFHRGHVFGVMSHMEVGHHGWRVLSDSFDVVTVWAEGSPIVMSGMGLISVDGRLFVLGNGGKVSEVRLLGDDEELEVELVVGMVDKVRQERVLGGRVIEGVRTGPSVGIDFSCLVHPSHLEN
eukprot:TRINITY_DN17437_c0_g2_i1.p1 TRINITY_DN17437_c0_g2~~TRINITY_DN17437_c0_g2_i1.p1  ORF type:complete len:358 (-),score=42.65 TRINITY_DN17437_c0_g2_i1:16-1068(-)